MIKAQHSNTRNSFFNRFSPRRRVLLVTPQPFYEDRGTPIAVEHTVRALSQLDYKVDVLSFPFGTDVSVPNLKLIRCDNPWRIDSIPIGFSWKKCLLDVSLLNSFRELLRVRHYDVVHAVEEAAYLAARVCPRFSKPFIYDMASSIPAELAHKPLLGTRPVQHLMTALERDVVKRAGHVICSIGLGEHVLELSPRAHVSEWRFPAMLNRAAPARIKRIRSELALAPTDKIIVYSGNFARYQGIDLLFEAFDLLLRHEPKAVLVCVGATEDEIAAWDLRLQHSVRARVRLVKRQPKDEIAAYLKCADCLVSLRPESRNFPLKIFEYMAAEKPIVATLGPAHEPILNSQRAFLCKATPAAIAAAMRTALDSPVEAATRATAAARYARGNFGWEHFVRFLGDIYEETVRGGVDTYTKSMA